MYEYKADHLKAQSLCLIVSISLLAGCTTFGEIPIDPEKLKALKAEPEVRIVHYPSYPLELFYYTQRGKYGGWLSRGFVQIEDPTSNVKNLFATGLKNTLNLNNIQLVSQAQPRSADQIAEYEKTYRSQTVLDLNPQDQLTQLKRTFGTGIVFDLDPITWTLYYSVVHETIFHSPKTMSYELQYYVKGRLVRVENSKVLWKAVCVLRLPFHTNGEITPEKLIANDQSILYVKRHEAAEKCGNELLTKLLGTQGKGPDTP